MESPAIARYIPQKSKKRMFPGSSSACMEPEVIEISPPPNHRTSKSKAKTIESKKVVYHEIIDVDMDEDRNEVVFVEGKVESNRKRKRPTAISLGPSNAAQSYSVDRVQSTRKVESNKGKDVATMPSKQSSASQPNPVDVGRSSNGFAPGYNNFSDLDGVGSDSYVPDLYADDCVLENDYLSLQSHFDNIDLPSGIEAPIPWLPDILKMKKRSSGDQLATSHTQLEASHMHMVDPVWASMFPTRNKNISAVQSGSSYSSLPTKSNPKNVPSVETPHKIQHQNMPSYCTYDQLGGMKVPAAAYFSNNFSTPIGSSTSSSFSQLPMDTAYPLGVDTPISKRHKPIIKNHQLVDQDAGSCPKSSSLVGSSSSMARLDNEDVLKKYESFKKFDMVLDHSDHYYSKQSSAMMQPPKAWAKRIQEEWRILEKDLPDTIFVRVYESRMDLLRAVIIGAEGTPYHDGLFFFDVCFPSNYPSVPPLVHYHSGGLRINPNLYNCGKVCLSLLNTWTGGPKERWVPGISTMLQVLVSIQGLILNTKPYYNEPGYANSSGSVRGEQKSVDYNEKTLILSLRTMVYTMKKPPKNFEDLVIGHFRNRVRDILMACKAYTEGVQVGCLVRGGVQDVDEGSKSCSRSFKHNVTSYIKVLIGSFKEIGAKEAVEFLPLSEKKSPVASSAHPPAYPPFPFSSVSAGAGGYNNYW